MTWSRFHAGGENLRQVAFRVRGPQLGVLVFREDSVIDTLTGIFFPALLFLLLSFPVGLLTFLFGEEAQKMRDQKQSGLNIA